MEELGLQKEFYLCMAIFDNLNVSKLNQFKNIEVPKEILRNSITLLFSAKESSFMGYFKDYKELKRNLDTYLTKCSYRFQIEKYSIRNFLLFFPYLSFKIAKEIYQRFKGDISREVEDSRKLIMNYFKN
tara:strand:- start:114 stop:500 length:387 start_codon:yes stop_codon:yes gene_type:complete